jgi:hypothetical protein
MKVVDLIVSYKFDIKMELLQTDACGYGPFPRLIQSSALILLKRN